MSTADSAQVVQFDDNGTADHGGGSSPTARCKYPERQQRHGARRGPHVHRRGANVVQFRDNGTADHLWEFLPDTGG